MSGADPLLVEVVQDAARTLIQRHKRPVRIGISGAQGSGKSTLAAALAKGDPRIATFSLDDIYLTTAARKALADQVSPLLKTRGAPGTHDLDLGKRTILQLEAARSRDRTPLPRFDKLADAPVKSASWPSFLGTPNVTIVDGWCMGALPQPEEELIEPINDLEARDDKTGAWRGFVNDQIAGAYAAFFARFDAMIALEAPDFGVVERWRLEQEAALRGTAVDALPREVRANIGRFVLHYERITRAMLKGLRRAEIVIPLGPDRAVLDVVGAV
jgi:D-glycerate 3-kinase